MLPLFLRQSLWTKPRLQLSANPRYLILPGEENENASRRQAVVNLSRLANSLGDVIRSSPPIEMNSHGVLTAWDVDRGRWSREQILVLGHVAYPKSSGHNDQTKGLQISVSGNTGQADFKPEVYLDIVLSLCPHIFPKFQHPTENANQDIRIHTPLVRFVNNQDRILA